MREKLRGIGMTTKDNVRKNESAPYTIPFEPMLYEDLKDHIFMAYFLADALNDRQNKHAVETALKHIIRANRDNALLALIAIHFALKKLNHSQLSRIIDFMEEEIDPQYRTVLAAEDTFVNLRKLVNEMRRIGRPPDKVRIQITREPAPKVSALDARLNALKSSLQKEFGQKFAEVESALTAA